jgi:hypothetical protein
MQKRSIVVMLIVLLCSASLVFAADQAQDRTRDQKKDGSCKLIENPIQNSLAADQTSTQSQQQKRIRKSTGTDLVDTIDGRLLADDQDRIRDRKRDGSCKSIKSMDSADSNLLAADQIRKQDRKRDGSCKG